MDYHKMPDMYRAEREHRKGIQVNENTSRSRRRYAFRQQKLEEYKCRPCADCGGDFPPCCMDLDHRDPATKVRQAGNSRIKNISDALRRLSLTAFMEEIEKCDVICANCHRIREWLKYRDDPESHRNPASSVHV